MAKVNVIEITSPTCGVCKMIEPMVKKAVESFTPEQLEFRRLCVGVDAEADEIAKRDNIQSVPVFYFSADDKDTLIHQGSIILPQFKKFVNGFLA